MKKLILPALAIFVLLGGLIMAIILTKQNQDIREKAATPSGTTSIVLSPGTGNLAAGSQATIAINANTGSLSIDGFQVIATVSGTIPTDLQFVPFVPTGMQQLLSSLSAGVTRTLKLAYVTQDTQAPFSAGSTSLGQFKFTVPASGTMTITFDNDLTKIAQNQTSQDVLAIPTPATYTFLTGDPGTSPTPGASTSPSPSPSATPGTCTRAVQSISMSPNSQQGTRGKKLSYTITVTNNDDKACDAATFILSSILPYAGFSTSFSTTILKINPQSTATATIDVTSSSGSPLGDIPIGVMATGPKAAVVAASIYKVLAPVPVAATTKPEVVYTTGGIATPKPSSSPLTESSPLPEGYVAPKPQTISEKISELFAGIPQNYLIIGLGVIIFAIVLWLLGKIFAKKEDNNPPQITPPTQEPPTMPTQATEPPTITHGIEPPMQNQ